MKNLSQELDDIVEYLFASYSIRITDIVADLEMKRYDYDNIRRSGRPARINALINRINSKYPNEMAGFKPTIVTPVPVPTITDLTYPDKLILILERENLKLSNDNLELRELLKENNRLVQDLLKKLGAK